MSNDAWVRRAHATRIAVAVHMHQRALDQTSRGPNAMKRRCSVAGQVSMDGHVSCWTETR